MTDIKSQPAERTFECFACGQTRATQSPLPGEVGETVFEVCAACPEIALRLPVARRTELSQ